MCIHQLTIPTRTRIISLVHRQPLLQSIPCGECCECQQQKFNEWYYRIYHEWLHCIENGGYVYFTTLTYADAYLPHLSDFMAIEPNSELDYSCFSREHLRGFVTRLTERVKYDYGMQSDTFRRFIAAEYGSDDDYIDDYGRHRVGTFRPHYHCLFFVYDNSLSVNDLHDLIFDSWKMGRVDGVRERGEKANVFRGSNQRSQLAVSNYVAKYVQKISKFQSAINQRISKYMDAFESWRCETCVVVKDELDVDSFDHRFALKIDYVEDDSVKFWQSQTYKRERARLKRCVDQFHLQNQGFGLCALRDIDVNEVMNNGFLVMPDCQLVVRKIAFPKYYERKIFDELVNVNGFRIWQPTELGLIYRRKKRERLVQRLADKFECVNQTYSLGLNVDFNALARYCVYYKGRMDGRYGDDPRPSDLVRMPNSLLCYNYSCPSDIALYHEAYVTNDFAGCAGEYYAAHLDDAVPLARFIRAHAITDKYLPEFNGFDSALSTIYDALERLGETKQALFDYKQEIRNLKRHLNNAVF